MGHSRSLAAGVQRIEMSLSVFLARRVGFHLGGWDMVLPPFGLQTSLYHGIVYLGGFGLHNSTAMEFSVELADKIG